VFQGPSKATMKSAVRPSAAMATRERPADRGRRRCRESLHRVALDARRARIGAGLSQREVALAIGVSHSKVGRFERSGNQRSLEFVGALCAVVGLDLGIRAYPVGDPIRDRAQLALLERLRGRLHPTLRWRTEVPLPIPGDLRAWDAEVRAPKPNRWRARIEAETRIADGQALERRLALKLRDDPGGHLILLVSDTRANRAALRSIAAGFHDVLPLETRAILSALTAGRDPGGSGVVIL
jgi:transcriptional regulator with XRE-family HTH domain